MAGVDGCRGQWLAAVAGDPDEIVWRLVPTFRDLYDDASLSVIAVDVPIGLPESGVRACDVAARAAVGARRSSVFAAPLRSVLGCTTYAEAREVLGRAGGPSMSAQAFGIVAAVRDVDECVGPDDDERVVETFPELAFRLLAGTTLPGKRTANGVGERIRALMTWRADVVDLLTFVPSRVPVDDALDALVCLWSAQRWAAGERRTLGDGTRDARHLPMRIAPAP